MYSRQECYRSADRTPRAVGQGTELEHNFMKMSMIFLTRLFVDDTGETYVKTLFMTVYDSNVKLGNHFSFTCLLIWVLMPCVRCNQQYWASGPALPYAPFDVRQGYQVAFLIFNLMIFHRKKKKRKRARFENHLFFYSLSQYFIQCITCSYFHMGEN